jgi:hypothetical protein
MAVALVVPGQFTGPGESHIPGAGLDAVDGSDGLVDEEIDGQRGWSRRRGLRVW